MRKNLTRLLSILLVLAVLCTAMPVFALAEPVTQKDIPLTATGIYRNPRYADAVLPRSEVQPHDAEALSWDDIRYHSDLEAVTAAVRQALKEHKGIIDVGYQTTEQENGEDLLTAIWKEANAHTGVPTEGDYLDNAWYYVVYDVSGKTVDGVTYYIFTYIPSYFTTLEQEAEMDAAVAALLAELSLDNCSDYEKVKGVYNWICDNVDYDYDNLEDDSYLLKHSAYAALIDRKAVCQGYAVLLYRLLLELGIDCRVISGYSGDERHAWNIIGLDGAYYNADPTWDKGLSVFPRYFLCTENNFPDHTRASDFDTPAFHAAYPMAENPFVQKVAASGTLSNGMEWVLDGETGMLTISGKGAMPDFVNQGAPWFPYADNISGIALTEGITSVGKHSFGRCKNAVTAYIPTTVTKIGDNAFNNCRSLRAITLHEGITSIGSGAFAECTSLTELTLPGTVTSYGSSVFSHCQSLTRLTFAENTTYIPGIFYNCDSLRQITIPETVTEIDDTAFMDCDALEEVYLPASVATMGMGVFSHCSSLMNITVAEDNPSYTSVDGVLFSKDLTVLHCYPAGRSGAYTIPEGTVILAKNSFREAIRLTDVTFPDSLKTIGEYAFFNCHGLKDVVVGEGVETIENYGFGNCDNLRSVRLGSSIKELEGAFRYFDMSRTSRLETVYFTGDAPKIDKYTFYVDIEATCYYPAGNRTWTKDVLQNYGGKLTWVPFGSCDGEHSYETEVFPATCDKAGYTEYFCTVCGDCYQDHFTEPLGHSYEEDYSSEATCWSPAYTMYWCTVCGDSYMEERGEPLPHNYESTEYPATCYSGGFTEHWCIYCGDFYVDNLTDPVDHSYDRTVTEATCMEHGFTLYCCIFCGESYIDDWVDPVGHNYSTIVTEPSCLEGGYTEYYCSCGDWYMDDFTDPLEHIPGVPAVENKKPDGSCELVTCCEICGLELSREQVAAYLPGDVNGDGEIDTADVYLIVLYCNKRMVLNATQLLAADADGNGKVNTTDAYYIVLYYTERIDKFPAEK